MREIKFRAWAIEEKRMFEWEYIENRFYSLVNNESFKVMQFSGIKDKNGKEIYEGDIVKRSYGFSSPAYIQYTDGTSEKIESKENFMIDEVKWISADEGYDWTGFLLPGVVGDSEKGQYFEIIGNIYENHELLK